MASAEADDDSVEGVTDPRKLLEASRRLLRKGKGEEALQGAASAVAIFQRFGDAAGEADAECARVRALLDLGQDGEATKAAQEGLMGVRRSGERDLMMFRRREAPMLLATAEVQLRQGEVDGAVKSATKSHSYFQGVGEKWGAAEAQLAVARAHLQQSASREAIKAAESARSLFQGCGDKRGEVAALRVVADAHVRDARHRDAAQAAGLAQSLCGELGDPLGAARLQQLVVQALLNGHQHEEALGAARQAMRMATEADSRKDFAEALMLSARAHLGLREQSHATSAAQEALSIFQQLGERKSQADIGLELSHMLMQSGKLDDAARQAESAQRLFRELGDGGGRRETDETLCALELAPDIIESREAKARALTRRLVRSVESRDVPSFRQASKEIRKVEYKPMTTTRHLQAALEPLLASDQEGTLRFLRANAGEWPELAAVRPPRPGGLQDWTTRFFTEA